MGAMAISLNPSDSERALAGRMVAGRLQRLPEAGRRWMNAGWLTYGSRCEYTSFRCLSRYAGGEPARLRAAHFNQQVFNP